MKDQSKIKLTEKQESFCNSYLKQNNVFEAFIESDTEPKKEYGTKYYVYLLINPLDNSIFYVGKGKNKRAEGHLKENISGKLTNAKKHKTINTIIESGLIPEIVIFDNELEESDAYSIERELITLFKKTISNYSKGIVDKHSKNLEKAKIIVRGIVPFDVWLNRKQRTEAEIDLYKSCVEQITAVAEGREKFYDTFVISNGKLTMH